MAGTFTGSAGALAHLTPRPNKTTFNDNYLSIAGNDFNFTKQFLPEVYEQEVERFGNRTISGFLRMVGAEMPMASDTVTWSEQGRLHIAYDDVAVKAASTSILVFPAGHLISAGMTIVVSTADGITVDKAFVVSVATNEVTVACYGSQAALKAAIVTAGQAGATLKSFVYGSEYGKKSQDGGASIDASFTPFTNKPIILRDKYSVSGSDTAQIGWVEVTTEAGTGGYLWYLKSEHEARLRFDDYLEMSMIEAEIAAVPITNAAGATLTGSEGLFAAIKERGLVYNNSNFDSTTGYATGGTPSVEYAAPSGIDEFDTILQELDKQGAIEENMLFLDRQKALEFDNMLAAQNSYGAGGTSYGVFENSEDMALNLGFSGFRRGSYDFYKTDWKYLNDSTTRGLIADVEGVIVPAGVSTVYDQQLGSNIQRPFLHTRYRASEADDRRMKSWITGSVGGTYTTAADEMNVHFLSERCLVTQAANNFVLLTKTA
jgi:hypothetical protein